eukprot:TRINITY_DN10069_c0_g1_i1.p1 TRINITY_DN10069_c0_g1~~TRINITY_DN10069_c0_g1_i1.p1  ORF type:complete len:572 (+),score=54.53 TRINITY_DN10069_c0_g1_i1:226-1716(+)
MLAVFLYRLPASVCPHAGAYRRPEKRWMFLSTVALAALGGLYYSGAYTGYLGWYWGGICSTTSTLALILGLEKEHAANTECDTQHRSIAMRILCYSPLVYIGRISYSLYLWHFPLIAAADALALRWMSETFTGVRTLTVLSVSLVFAAMSRVVVELPALGIAIDAPAGRTKKVALCAIVIPLMSCVLLAVVLHAPAQRDVVVHLSSSSAEVIEPNYVQEAGDNSTLPLVHLITSTDIKRQHTKKGVHAVLSGDSNFSVLLMGDSHGGYGAYTMWYYAALDHGLTLDVHWWPFGSLIAYARSWISSASSHPYDAIVIYDYADQFMDAYVSDKCAPVAHQCEEKEVVQLASDIPGAVNACRSHAFESFMDFFRKFFTAISPTTQVFLVLPPSLPGQDCNCVSHHPEDLSACDFDAHFHPYRALLVEVADKVMREFSSFHVVDTSELLCPQGRCSMELKNGMPLYSDHHITPWAWMEKSHGFGKLLGEAGFVLPDGRLV